tara:strand:- start:751 stop:1377 length:627 start_codon:yes stop_codon:yes gene_type:complete
MRAYVINLKRSPERLKQFLDRWEKIVGDAIPLTVFTGYDSSIGAVPWWWKSHKGAFGCYMSHSLLSTRIIEDGAGEPVMIFEDDALLCDDFMEKLPDVMFESSIQNVDMLWLGGASRSKDKFIGKHIKVGSKVLGAYAYIVMPHYIEVYNELLMAAPTNLNNRHHYHGDIKMMHANRHTIQAKPKRWMVGCIAGVSTISGVFKEQRNT